MDRRKKMKYFLGFDLRKSKEKDHRDRYYPIKWNKMEEYQDVDWLDLENICLFTSSYEDYDDLLDDLISKGIINYHLRGKKLAIIYKKNNIYQRIDFDVPFKNEKKYFDIIYLKWYLKSQKNNLDLLTKLSKYLRTKLPYKSNNFLIHPLYEPICALEEYINQYKNGYEPNFDMFLLTMDAIVDRLCCAYDKEKKTYKTNEEGEVIISFRQLRDLAMFIITNERIIKEEKNDTNKNKKEFKPLVRERTFPIYKQMSLFE